MELLHNGLVLRKTYPICCADADFSGRISAPALIRLLTDSGWTHVGHWQPRFAHLLAQDLSWVNTDLHLRVDRYPPWRYTEGQTLSVQTWLAGVDKFYWLRDFVIYDTAGVQIGCATTTSILLHLQTRRPYWKNDGLGASLIAERPRAFGAESPQAQGRRRPARQLADSQRAGEEFGVQLCDLDANRHASNARYLEWLLNSYDSSFCNGHEVAEVQLHYAREALYGQSLAVFRREGGLRHNLTLRRSAENQTEEILWAELRWRSIWPEKKLV